MAIGDLMGMMSKARELQEKMQQVQEEVAAMDIVGTAGAGLVTVTMDGKGNMKALTIDPSLIKPDEAEILEDLVIAASNDARTRAEAALAERMREMTAELGLPAGLSLPGLS